MGKKFLTAEEKMEACTEYPEREQIFALEKMLSEAGYPYYFNFREENKDDINWDEYKFLIEVGRPAGYALSQISVTFSNGNDKKLLELLDMRPAGDKEDATAEEGELTIDLTAEQCMEIIEKFFKG